MDTLNYSITTARILVVDDNEVDMDLSKRILGRIYPSVELHGFFNGKQAIDFLFSSNLDDKPTLMILDLNMPVMNGYEVLEQVQNSPLKKFPIIIFSSTTIEEEIERCYQLGASDFYEKPFGYFETIDLFQNLITLHLEKQKE